MMCSVSSSHPFRTREDALTPRAGRATRGDARAGGWLGRFSDELPELQGNYADTYISLSALPTADARGLVDSEDRRLVCSDVLEAWCSGLTCSPVKAVIAGSNPVASAGAFFSVRVDTLRAGKSENEGSKIGPWHDRYGRSVAHDQSREQLSSQLVPLHRCCHLPGARHIGEKGREPLSRIAFRVALGWKHGQRIGHPLALRLVLGSIHFPVEVEVLEAGELTIQSDPLCGCAGVPALVVAPSGEERAALHFWDREARQQFSNLILDHVGIAGWLLAAVALRAAGAADSPPTRAVAEGIDVRPAPTADGDAGESPRLALALHPARPARVRQSR